MAYERNPNDPYRPIADNEPLRDAARLDNELQPDPELAEGPASGARIALFALAAALIIGAVIYGVNNTSTTTTANSGATAPPAATSQTTTPKTDRSVAEQNKPPVAPGVRDVTPYNAQPGTTTGAASAQPQQPAQTPSSAPANPSINQPASPPASDK